MLFMVGSVFIIMQNGFGYFGRCYKSVNRDGISINFAKNLSLVNPGHSSIVL